MPERIHYIFDHEPGRMPDFLREAGWILKDGARFAYPKSIGALFLDPKMLTENPDYVVTGMSVSMKVYRYESRQVGLG